MTAADAVGLAGVVERRALAEAAGASLLAAPGADGLQTRVLGGVSTVKGVTMRMLNSY